MVFISPLLWGSPLALSSPLAVDISRAAWHVACRPPSIPLVPLVIRVTSSSNRLTKLLRGCYVGIWNLSWVPFQVMLWWAGLHSPGWSTGMLLQQLLSFCGLQDWSKQIVSAVGAHSDKTVVKDSLRCLQRGRNTQQSFVLTWAAGTWRTPSAGKPQERIYFILCTLNKLLLLDICRPLNWHMKRIRNFFSSHTVRVSIFHWSSTQPSSLWFLSGTKAQRLVEAVLLSLVPCKEKQYLAKWRETFILP